MKNKSNDRRCTTCGRKARGHVGRPGPTCEQEPLPEHLLYLQEKNRVQFEKLELKMALESERKRIKDLRLTGGSRYVCDAGTEGNSSDDPQFEIVPVVQCGGELTTHISDTAPQVVKERRFGVELEHPYDATTSVCVSDHPTLDIGNTGTSAQARPSDSEAGATSFSRLSGIARGSLLRGGPSHASVVGSRSTASAVKRVGLLHAAPRHVSPSSEDGRPGSGHHQQRSTPSDLQQVTSPLRTIIRGREQPDASQRPNTRQLQNPPLDVRARTSDIPAGYVLVPTEMLDQLQQTDRIVRDPLVPAAPAASAPSRIRDGYASLINPDSVGPAPPRYREGYAPSTSARLLETHARTGVPPALRPLSLSDYVSHGQFIPLAPPVTPRMNSAVEPDSMDRTDAPLSPRTPGISISQGITSMSHGVTNMSHGIANMSHGVSNSVSYEHPSGTEHVSPRTVKAAIAA